MEEAQWKMWSTWTTAKASRNLPPALLLCK